MTERGADAPTPDPADDPRGCPCGSRKPLPTCCGRFHTGQRVAPTASALMRSRYAAFALGLERYLLDTWHPTTRPDSVDLDDATTWTGLVIESATGGRAWDTEGTVSFAASFTSPEGDGVLRENSRFRLVDGRWLYLDGVHR